MKRSQVNRYIQEFIDFVRQRQFALPPWAFFSPEKWAGIGPEADELRRCALGWDVTDFGSDEFLKIGLTLFTLRNGRPGQQGAGAKDYCEKIMMVRDSQVTPFHFHFSKMEDIINRGGGRLVIQLHNSLPDGLLDMKADVSVQVDGFTRRFPAGGQLVLEEGESVTLVQGLYHQFWGENDGGPVLVGEVSRVNDDAKDNRFLQPLPRFPAIQEDEPKRFLLCNEYPPAK
jgi:hypothetical protein